VCVDAARLIAEVALAWPGLTVAAVVRRRDEAHGLAHRLRAFLPGVDVVTGDDRPAAVERVVVSTFGGLSHAAAYRGTEHRIFDVSWLDIVIVLDADGATGKAALAALSRAWRARMYGLVDVNARPAPLDRDHLAALFGFAEAIVPSHGHRERS